MVGREWLVERMPRLMSIIKQAKRKNPSGTLRAVFNEEYEYISREAKIEWAEQQGHHTEQET